MAKLNFRTSDKESKKTVTRKKSRNHRAMFWISLILNYIMLGLLCQR